MTGNFFLLERLSYQPSEKQTLGILTCVKDFKTVGMWKTLELPWRENKRNESCIPLGVYPLEKRTSYRYKEHLHVTNVPDRALILIHPGNYFHNTRGCILPGMGHAYIDDGIELDVTSSKMAMREILRHMEDGMELIIIQE